MAPPSTPDKYPPPEAFDEIVSINIGTKTSGGEAGKDSFMIDKTFKVHKGIVSFYSGYFDACFNGEFAEAGRGAVDLEDEVCHCRNPFSLLLASRKTRAYHGGMLRIRGFRDYFASSETLAYPRPSL